MAGAMFSPQAGMRISFKAQGSRLDPILFAYLRRPDDASHTPFRVRGATACWWKGLFSPAMGIPPRPAAGIPSSPFEPLSEYPTTRVVVPRMSDLRIWSWEGSEHFATILAAASPNDRHRASPSLVQASPGSPNTRKPSRIWFD